MKSYFSAVPLPETNSPAGWLGARSWVPQYVTRAANNAAKPKTAWNGKLDNMAVCSQKVDKTTQ